MLNRNGATQQQQQASNGHEPQAGPSNGNVNGNALTPFAEQPFELDIIKIIGQHLRQLGLHRAVATLSEESGITLDHPLAAQLQNHVMHGQIDEAIGDISELEPFLIGSNANKKMRFLLLENKFLELLAQNKIMEALTCLREQLSQLKHNDKRVHQLSSCLMMHGDCPELELYRTNLEEARNCLIRKLQKYLPANVMMPPRRLRSLLSKAQTYQVERCDFHNSPRTPSNEIMTEISLLTDHVCDKSNFPCHTTQILSEHCDEIWVCRFSHDGLKLATGSKDSTVIVWDVDPATQQLSHRKTFEGHTLGVSCLAWSPDDNFLLVCGHEDSSDLWIWNAVTGEQKLKMSHSADDSLTSCAWQSSGAKFITGGTRGQFYQCDLDGNVIDSWEGVRLQGVQCLSDGETVLAADNHNRIKSYNFNKMEDEKVVTEDHSIMTFTVDSTDRYVLLNLAQQGLHMWDIKDKTLMMRFRGITQGYYAIHSCFGGVDEKFVASGSEDSKVYIFNRRKETPIAVLEGHARCVNCVAWNPRFPSMLASVSDDATVRIWGPPPPNVGTSEAACGKSECDYSSKEVPRGPGDRGTHLNEKYSSGDIRRANSNDRHRSHGHPHRHHNSQNLHLLLANQYDESSDEDDAHVFDVVLDNVNDQQVAAGGGADGNNDPDDDDDDDDDDDNYQWLGRN